MFIKIALSWESKGRIFVPLDWVKAVSIKTHSFVRLSVTNPLTWHISSEVLLY